MAVERLAFTKDWKNADDFAMTRDDAAGVRADIQELHDQTKNYINQKLAPAVDDCIPRSEASASYLKKADAANTYLSKTDAATDFLAKEEATSDYLTKTLAAEQFATREEINQMAMGQIPNKSLTLTKFSDANFEDEPTENSEKLLTSGAVFAALAAKSDAAHDHDDRYYTREQMNEKLAGLGGFSVGTNPPTKTSLLWIDTTAKTGGLKYYNGSAWVPVPVCYAE